VGRHHKGKVGRMEKGGPKNCGSQRGTRPWGCRGGGGYFRACVLRDAERAKNLGGEKPAGKKDRRKGQNPENSSYLSLLTVTRQENPAKRVPQQKRVGGWPKRGKGSGRKRVNCRSWKPL